MISYLTPGDIFFAINLTGGGTSQCFMSIGLYIDYFYWNGTEYTIYTADQLASAVSAMTSVIETLGTVTVINPVNLPFIGLPTQDWAAYYTSWQPDPSLPGEDCNISLTVPTNGPQSLTSTQISSLVSGINSAIADIPYSGSATLVEQVFTPSSVLSPPDQVPVYSSACITNYTSTTEGDLPGTSVSVVVTKPNSTVTVTGVFDMQSGATTSACVGRLNWNGTTQTPNAVVAGAIGNRTTASQVWTFTGVAPGTYVAKLRGSVNSSTGVIRATHTTMNVTVS